MPLQVGVALLCRAQPVSRKILRHTCLEIQLLRHAGLGGRGVARSRGVAVRLAEALQQAAAQVENRLLQRGGRGGGRFRCVRRGMK